MKRFGQMFLMLLLTLWAAQGFAQEVGQPGDPMTPAPEMAAEPEIPDVAWVRLANFSPNASEISVNFEPSDEEVAAGFQGEELPAVGYREFTEYVEIPAGNYTVTAEGVEGMVEEEFSFARGAYFTLATMGLVLPEEVQAQQEDGEEAGGGFVGFFQNLFGEGDGNRDRLALQFTLIEDDLTRVPPEGETLVRVVHAAPGTEPVDLAVEGEQGTLLNDVAYGEASRYASFDGSFESLEVRLSGSRAATLALDEITLDSANLNTVYVVGTPVEEAPLTLMGSSLAPVEVGTPAGEDVAVQAEQAGEAAGGGAAEDEAVEAEEQPAGEEQEAAEPAEEGEAAEPAEQPEQPAAEEQEPAAPAGEDPEEEPVQEGQ